MEAQWSAALPRLEAAVAGAHAGEQINTLLLGSTTLARFSDEVRVMIKKLQISSQTLGISGDLWGYQDQWAGIIADSYAKKVIDGEFCLELIADSSALKRNQIIKTVIFDSPDLADSPTFARLMLDPEFAKFANAEILN